MNWPKKVGHKTNFKEVSSLFYDKPPFYDLNI